MTEAKKPTPAQRIKQLEAEKKKLEDFIMKSNHDFGQQLATAGNENYSLGFQQGYDQAKVDLAVQRADAGIARFFRK